MKKFLLITGYTICGILALLYFSFLFVLPHRIDLAPYKSDIQKLVKDYTGLNLDYGKVRIITTPLLEAGLKVNDITLKLPDKSEFFSAKTFKGKVFLPSLLWLSVRVTCARLNDPHITLDIENGEQFKAAKVYADIVNKRRQDKLAHPEKYAAQEEMTLPFDVTKIKVNIPQIKLNHYKAVIDDIAANHSLTLKGDQLKLGYFNGRTAKIKTEAKFLSDKNTNITANIDIDSALPRFIMPPKEEEDLEAVYVVPFVNPVSIYRDYELKSNINSKIKIRKAHKGEHLKINGFFNVEDTTLKMSGLQLPKSHFRFTGKGYKSEIESNLYVTGKEYIKFTGLLGHGRKPFIDFALDSTQVHLDNLLKIARAYLDTIHIKNDIENMSASGYFLSDAKLKTDFKQIESSGQIVVRDANIVNKNLGILFNDIKMNLIFDNNSLNIKDTHIMVNDKPLDISGKINSNSVADLVINGKGIPLAPLYKSFAPRDIKNRYDLNSGVLTIDAKITGEIKNLITILKCNLEKLKIKDKAENFILSNESAYFGVASHTGVIRGRLSNKGFNLILPKLHSVIKSNNLVTDIDNDKIVLNPVLINFNKNSAISINGEIKDYLSSYDANFKVDGNISASDLGIVLGDVLLPYFDVKGIIPVKANFDAKGNKMKFVAQAKASAANYISPVLMKDFAGKDTILQFHAEKNRDTLKVEKTGLFVKGILSEFSDNLDKNLRMTRELVSLKAIISNITFQPFISLFKLNITHDLEGSLVVLKKSKFKTGGNLFVYGKPESPTISGQFVIKDIIIPEIYSRVDRITTELGSNDIRCFIDNVNANGSHFNLIAKTNWKLLPEMKIFDVNVNSKFININKIMKVSEAIVKVFPTSEQNRQKRGIEQRTDIPLSVLSGKVNLRRIVMDKIIVNNTTADICLLKSVLYVSRLKTHPLGGIVAGKASFDVIDMLLKAEVSGKKFNVEKVLLDVMNMKDMLSGDMNFVAKLSMKGTQLEEQMKSLKGTIDFNIKNGQLGPFGKFENFIMAENIRNNKFFSTALGSIINNILSFDTSRFNELYGHLSFKNGIAEISPIKSQGNVMSMYIFGNLNLLDNSAEIRVRGKLASAFSDKLGPLANLNPINLVKHTPGLNIVLAKTFSIFCEAVSESEMKALPHLAEGKSDENATKFQIKLKGDTRKPLKMIKSFKWLALNSEIEAAKDFVDTIPTPEAGEEGMTVEELIQLRKEQAEAKAAEEAAIRAAEERKPINRIKKILKISK